MRHPLLLAGLLLAASSSAHAYDPPPLRDGRFVDASLGNGDIPTGQGGFFRDYRIDLREGDLVIATLDSDDFDPDLTLIGPDGQRVAYDDDGGEGLNAMLVGRIKTGGRHLVRVGSVGDGNGRYRLRLDSLRR